MTLPLPSEAKRQAHGARGTAFRASASVLMVLAIVAAGIVVVGVLAGREAALVTLLVGFTMALAASWLRGR